MFFLFIKAWCGLVIYDVYNVVRKFRDIHSIVKSWKVSDKKADSDTVERVSRALNYACVFYFKQALCLQRSFVRTYLLRRLGVPAQMVWGAQKMPFKAHSWVEIEGKAVDERMNVQAYAVWEKC